MSTHDKYGELRRLDEIVNRIAAERGLPWDKRPFDEIPEAERQGMADALREWSAISAVARQEPVAWRYRYHYGAASENKGMWKYADTEDECNQSAYYEREALYASPSASGDSIPLDDIREQIVHIEQNGLSLAKYGGQDADEGRCRELCAMYLREMILNHGWKKRIEEMDRAIDRCAK